MTLITAIARRIARRESRAASRQDQVRIMARVAGTYR